MGPLVNLGRLFPLGDQLSAFRRNILQDLESNQICFSLTWLLAERLVASRGRAVALFREQASVPGKGRHLREPGAVSLVTARVQIPLSARR